MKIAVDVMGGDNAPSAIIGGTALAAEAVPDAEFLLFGDEKRVMPLLDKRPQLKAAATLIHTDDVVLADDKASTAMRQRSKSSMRLAINAVANGEADFVVSAGNTGALMAMAKLVLKPMEGVIRPAIAGPVPTVRTDCVMLDLGANVDCHEDHLVQFAVMGAVFAKILLKKEKPTIGLLNVGSEDMKGRDMVRKAAAILKERPLPGDFIGFVEGNHLAKAAADVIVTDGFTGNVSLKSIEGTAKMYADTMRRAYRSSFIAKMGYMLSRGALGQVKDKMDPRHYNGAMFLGLKHVCIKSHGGTDAYGFSHAIQTGVMLVKEQLNERIHQRLDALGMHMTEAVTPAETPEPQPC